MAKEDTVLQKQVIDSLVRRANMLMCRITLQIVGGILYVFLSPPVEAGEVSQKPAIDSSAAVGVLQRIQSTGDLGKQRDPFRPIKKRRVISASSKKEHFKLPTITPTPVINNPNWKLLGIIEGRYGRQAVIQVAPQERVLIRSGLEVARSGWIIKTIGKGEVLLEHSSSGTSGKGLSEPKAFILSFETLGNFPENSG